MNVKYIQYFWRKHTRMTILVPVSALLAGCLGWALVLSLNADTSTTASFQAEAATKTGVTTVSDATAAGGSAITFGAAASGSVKAIDSANTITDPNWFVQAYAAGIRLYVMQATNWDDCNPWNRTQTQLKMALDAGMKIAIYTRNPNCWQGGITATGPYKDQLQFFAIDVESDPGIKVTQAMVDSVRATGVRPVIYSGSGMWPEVMGGNVTTFSDVPLWDTNTSTINFATWTANILSPTPQQYGGWNTASTMRVGIQQMFEYNLNGVAVDLNSFSASFLQ